MDTVHIPRTGVLTVHQVEDTITATLYRQVDMLAHIGHLGDDAQGVVAHILGMRGGEAHTHLWHSLGHPS